MEPGISFEPSPETIRPKEVSSGSTVEQRSTDPTLETESPPAWFRDTVAKIADAWFDPKSFEEHTGLYEKLGVKTFKKYMPTGDLFYLSAWKKLTGLDAVQLNSPLSLKNMEVFTRVFETIHLVGFAVMSAEMGVFVSHQEVKSTVLASALNMLINVYPIMVQRYNRVRLYRTINQLNLRNIKQNEHSK